ncbi:MAG: DNA internalization-related competence protein ComEC/Rec2, partial [Pseudomonadota bacterium]
GVEALIRGMEVGRIMSGEALDFMDVERCRSDQTWEWDGVSFRILHPHESDNFSGSNNSSCVLMVESSGGSLLITGDIERKAEEKLLERHAESLQADILIAPHHGSNTSSSGEFVQRVNPEYVLFPTGYRNRFGFPKQPVIERWQAAGSTLLNTAETGAIQFRILANQALTDPMLYRRDHQHYWSMPFKIE